MEVNVYFNGPATEIDMGPREFSVIPAAGADGQPGRDGTIENLNVAATTLPAGSQATASYEDNLLTLGIPQGAKGNPGDDGQDGVGIPSGGTTGQVLKKASATDYDTEWGNATGGGGTWGSITGTLSDQTDLQAALDNKGSVPISFFIAATMVTLQTGTWSTKAVEAGAPSGGTCYYTTISSGQTAGITTKHQFVCKFLKGFSGVVYITSQTNGLLVEASENTTEYAISGIFVETLKDFGATKIFASDAGYIPVMPNSGFHNGIYRGKYLGSSVTAAQYAAISAGTFEDLFIGDYWTINGVNWRIASFDYWYGYGDTPCTTHHVAILPDTGLTNAQMNSTNITTGAYAGTDFRTGSNGNTGMADALGVVNSAFGSEHVLQHRILIRNAATNGFETAGAAVDSKIEVMTETQVYGTIMFRNQKQGTNWASYQTLDDTQLPLFLLNRVLKNIGVDYWLRDVGDTTGFCCVGALGQCSVTNASASFAIRPIFGICA